MLRIKNIGYDQFILWDQLLFTKIISLKIPVIFNFFMNDTQNLKNYQISKVLINLNFSLKM